jgi:CHAT domain-containing protein
MSNRSLHPLTVANLFETNLRGHTPFLAYLSACGTGQVKLDQLIDEGLHLISACQLAGFQHVIGTLWQANDKSCVDMATMTYTWMKERGISDVSVSEGFHHACRRLRDQWISENTARRAFRQGKGVQNTKVGQMAMKRSHSSQCNAGDTRDAELCDDTGLSPLYWAPYVHFGV